MLRLGLASRHTQAVVAGRLEQTRTTPQGPVLSVAYGRRYRDRTDAISLFTPELPLRAGTFDPGQPAVGREPALLAGCLRDASPDAWGRRVANLRLGHEAAFWDGSALLLTPGYDLTPQPRSTQTSTQAIAVTEGGVRASQLWAVRASAPAFRLSAASAASIVDEVVDAVRAEFDEAAEQATLSAAERDTFRGREILNPYIFYD